MNLNELAIAAKNDEGAAWEVKAHYMPLIEKLQTENWYKMNNETAFESDCFRKIDYAVKTYDSSKGDFDKRARTLIYQSLKEYCGRRGDRRNVLYSLDKEVVADGNTDVALVTLLVDETVDVEAKAIDEITKKELMDKLATNDMEKTILEIILNAEELITQSEITRQLSKRTGRTFNSARGAVRTFCARKQAALC